MKKLLFALPLIGGLLSCGNKPVYVKSRTDSMICAYVENGQWRFNVAEVWTHMGRKFKGDSGLEAENGVIQQIKLELPPNRSDSIIDSATHKLLKIMPRFGQPIPDSLNHYIHLLDTLHYK